MILPFIAFSGVAHASGQMTGTINYVSCYSGKHYCAVLMSSYTGPATCPDGTTAGAMTVNLGSQSGIGQLKLILAAKASNWSITIFGAGTCNDALDQEDISYVQMHP